MKTDACSIVLCTFDRLDYLKKCLASLLNLDFSKYEIIVVNDGSSDGTREYLDSLDDEKIKVIHLEGNQGACVARNTGIEAAQYDVVAFTDDDCVVDRRWLFELSKGFVREEVGFVIGQVFYIEKGYTGYFPERLVMNKDAQWPMGCNMAFRKSILDTHGGGFDEVFFKYHNEDSEIAIRAVSNGFTFERAAEAVVFHQAMTWTVSSLLSSARNASVWPVLKKKYPRHYHVFGPPVKFGFFVNIEDYVYLITSPVFIPLLFARYLLNGNRDIIIFFTKWPVYLLLRRFYVYKEAVLNRVFMI